MVTLAVLAILATIAVPSFQDIIKRNQITAQTNELIALIYLARNEAIRRNPVGSQSVSVEFWSDPGAGTWEGAVFPPGATETAEGCPDGAIRCASHTRVLLSPDSGLQIHFDNRGYSVDPGGSNLEEATLTLRHQDCTSTTKQHARQVTIRRTGQVSYEPVGCD